MKEITKPVHRRTRSAYRTLYHEPRKIVVTVCPGDVLEFREHGRRCRFLLAIDTAFRYAIRLHALRSAAEKKQKRHAP